MEQQLGQVAVCLAQVLGGQVDQNGKALNCRKTNSKQTVEMRNHRPTYFILYHTILYYTILYYTINYSAESINRKG